MSALSPNRPNAATGNHPLTQRSVILNAVKDLQLPLGASKSRYFRVVHHSPLNDSDGLKVGTQFRNRRQLTCYKGELFRAIEECPISDLIDLHIRIKRRCGDTGLFSLNRNYCPTPASFAFSKSAVECDNAPSSSLAIDGVPY